MKAKYLAVLGIISFALAGTSGLSSNADEVSSEGPSSAAVTETSVSESGGR